MAEQPFAIAPGQTALVSGAAKRLGRAVALALAGRGMNLVVHYRGSEEEACRTQTEIEALGVRAWTVQADLDHPGEGRRLFEEAVRVAGPIDVFVNNASIFPPSRLDDFRLEDLESCIRIHAWAPLEVCRGLAAQQRPGSLLHFLDARVVEYDAAHAAYHLSKRLLHSILSMQALEYAPRLRVNAIAPGLVLPPPGQGMEYLEKLAHTNPLGALGGPADIVRAALYLLESPFVTGQILYIDGGRHLKGKVYD